MTTVGTTPSGSELLGRPGCVSTSATCASPSNAHLAHRHEVDVQVGAHGAVLGSADDAAERDVRLASRAAMRARYLSVAALASASGSGLSCGRMTSGPGRSSTCSRFASTPRLGGDAIGSEGEYGARPSRACPSPSTPVATGRNPSASVERHAARDLRSGSSSTVSASPGSALERVLGTALARRADYADCYFEFASVQTASLEDGIVKKATRNVRQGVGVRVLAGARSGYAYTDEVTLERLELAARTARCIADHGSRRDARSRPRAGRARPHDLYPRRAPPLETPLADQVALLERLDRGARADDPRITQRAWPGIGIEHASC